MNDKERKPATIESIKAAVKAYLPNADFDRIDRAYLVAEEGHRGQTRISGEEYIHHPLSVAEILTELQMDEAVICAALLHDVVEDTLFTLDEIRDMFGDEVALLIDGVTKLGMIKFKSKEERQLETYRKMILATAQDIRVIIIKLADRLHNMRTLKFMRDDKRKRIARETMELYAPLANRLGISNIKWELEDLSFRYLEPDIYYEMIENVKQKRRERQIYISEAVRQIEEVFDDLDIMAAVSGRAKHFYSIYKKMKRDNKGIGEIYDLSAVRILVDTVQECYNVLGVIHSRWKPIPGRFKDYIAVPKSNGYRSLHTTVLALGYPLEIQIRTHAMHQISEYGIAAHWKYKESGKNSMASKKSDQQMSWLGQMVQMQKEFKDPKEYFEALKVDVFSDEVFVFTPTGDILSLPKGSNPIDFAYRVHTEVGHHCIGAKVNGKMVPLDYTLKNGDSVEIMTNRSNHGPSRDWINIVASSDTRSKIRSWFRRENRPENIEQGKAQVEAELRRLNYHVKDLMREKLLEETAAKLTFQTADDMFAALGYGGITLRGVTTKLIEIYEKENDKKAPDVTKILKEVNVTARADNKKSDEGILVEGQRGFFVRLAKCCCPIPGDKIFGYVTRGNGVSVHRVDCPNIVNALMDRSIEVSWEKNIDTNYNVELEIICANKSGVLTEILAIPSAMKLNMRSVHATPNDNDDTSTVKLGVDVQNADQVEQLMSRIRILREVYSVTRPTLVSLEKFDK
ncbi:MAG: bifunctional (p)ppGpp synthetase/guanosine-3',5'-bis(diphosphate) 3'-pyrophosphohydrolase [Selenomonadaceae bacterium]|nr:bifunctional (p)ppGpp synthetase/guanosine-3',5'-bis(diphosphate) 3'-pyrophosphohydrolase [Selenomonadaceae bacterium]